MNFFVSERGKFNSNPDTPTVKKIKAFLNKAKPGELLMTNQLGSLCKVSPAVIRQYSFAFKDYGIVHGTKKYWGSPATIKKFKKELAKRT